MQTTSDRIDLSGFVKPLKDGARRLDFAVEGITCAACIGEIETAMKPLPGLTRARVNYTTRRLAIEWQGDDLDPAEAVATLRGMGYRAHPFECAPAEAEDSRTAKFLLRCLAVAGFSAMNVMLLSVAIWAGNASEIDPATRDLFHWLSALIALPAAAFAGQPFFSSALRALRARSLNMDVPISLGIVLALGMSLVETARHAAETYFDSALMLLFFLLLGRYLENLMRQKTRAVAGNLAALRAPLAFRLSGDEGGGVLVPVNALVKGDRVLVRPGERISADGAVISGVSEVDESLVTGETRRRIIGPGDLVYAGAMNFTGALRLNVMAAGAGTLLDEIERLVETASSAKSRYVRLADRASRLYAPLVHLAALATAIGWLVAGAGLHDAIVNAIAVLIITCPCAIALAVPAVQVVASGALFRSGVLLNAGDAIERLAETDTVVFDKTGTLTLPEPRIVNAGEVPPDLLALAARLACSSHHPLARAIADAGLQTATAFDDATEQAGHGVRAVLDGIPARLGSAAFCGFEAQADAALARDPEASAIVVRHGDRAAVLLVRQMLREDARAVIDALKAGGHAIEILSGDRPEAVGSVAASLGIGRWSGGLKPAEKVARLAELRAAGRHVLMVGDGLNDAPALAAAHVSLSPITAADVAQAASDAVFLGDRLAPVADALAIARRSRRLMRQNLQFAVAYNLVAVPLAMSGTLTPLIAALAMSGSSLLVTLNALRASRQRQRVADRAVPSPAPDAPPMRPLESVR